MPGPTSNRAIQTVSRLRRLPVAKLLAIAEVVVLARKHVRRLDPRERRRLLELIRRGRGRRRNLSPKEQAELAALVAKAEPRLFVSEVARKLSPVPLPDWMLPDHKKR